MKGWTLLRALVVGLCLVMTGWLIRYEAFPGWFAQDFPGYAAFFRGGTLLSDRWARILYQDEPIGYSHTLIDTQQGDTDTVYRVQNFTLLQMKLLGQVQTIKIEVEAFLDALYQLQRFRFQMSASAYSAHIRGRRAAGHQFDVEVETGAGVSHMQVEIPPDVVLYSPMTDMAMRRLRPGQEMVIRTLDPVSMARIDVICRALGPDRILFQGEERDALALTMTYQGLTVRTWLDEQGEVLRQETPLGWTMEASTMEEVMALRLDAEVTTDLVLANAVPVAGVIQRPRECGKLVLRLHNLHLPMEGLQSSRQHVEFEPGGAARLTLHRKPLPEHSALLNDPVPDELAEHLQATAFVQADHPEILAKARAIIGDASTRRDAARALSAWVDQNVVDVPTASLPSALDVLRQRVGDCNEHTYLFVALARAVGIPARIHVGLLYTDGMPGPGFYYHAWPGVHLGDDWYEMDPTLGQDVADATHITLLIGEIQEQMRLLSVIGQLRAEILDQRHETAGQRRIGHD